MSGHGDEQIRILNAGLLLYFITVPVADIPDDVQRINSRLNSFRPRFNHCNLMTFFTELFGKCVTDFAAACNNNFHNSTSK